MIGEFAMRKSTKRELWVLFILTLISIVIGMALREYNAAKELQAGEKPQSEKRNMLADYDFKAKDLNGNPIVLSEYKGKKIFINFWSASIRPCKKEMADIEALYNETKGTDLVILSVNAADAEDKARAFVDGKGYSFPIILDNDGKITKQYNVVGIPTSFFIDKDGYLDDMAIGAINLEKMKEYISNLD